jgi:hypothetical protein
MMGSRGPLFQLYSSTVTPSSSRNFTARAGREPHKTRLLLDALQEVDEVTLIGVGTTEGDRHLFMKLLITGDTESSAVVHDVHKVPSLSRLIFATNVTDVHGLKK